MNIKIEINSDGYPLPHNPTIDEVIAARIQEQEAILNALSIEVSKANEKMKLLQGILSEASRPRSVGL